MALVSAALRFVAPLASISLFLYAASVAVGSWIMTSVRLIFGAPP
jgi:hypothetical protein